MNTSQIGNIGESRVLLEFTKLGIPCYVPFGDGQSADIIAEFNGKLNKLQVKTSSKLNACKAMEWKVTKQDGHHGSRQAYSLSEVDYFALYCLETDIVCLVPFTEDFPITTLSIRLDDYAGERSTRMRFAGDYSVERIAVTHE